MVEVRRSVLEDGVEIEQLLNLAFSPSRYESHLRRLVFEGDSEFIEWVALDESKLIASILFTSATRGDEPVGLHLAPVAVHPEWQGRGIGTLLIESALEQPPVSERPVFVLGDPDFYRRFGFQLVKSPICQFDENNEHFAALRWDNRGGPFQVGYHSAFFEAQG